MNTLKTVYSIVLKPIRGSSHGERLESFYRHQSNSYDEFRSRLLPGREELLSEAIRHLKPGASWIDIGCGTASNLEIAPQFTVACERITLIDLCEPLLTRARARVRRLGLSQVEVIRGDAASATLPPSDLVTFSFSLTMIPNWFLAIDAAINSLKPGGIIAVVDFFVSRRYHEDTRSPHPFLTRTFWPMWFGLDNVNLNPDHIPYLTTHTLPLSLIEGRSSLPFLPFVRVPFYRFIGRRKSENAAAG